MMMRDPIARYAQTQMEPFSWREAFNDSRTKNRAVEGLIREVGFCDGLAFPIRTGETNQLGIISLGTDRLDVDPRTIGALRLACIHAYVAIERLYGPFAYLVIPRLTPRQSDILHYAAGGKSNFDIATIIGISPNSVRDHLLNASKKLGTYGRAHTIAVAMSLGLVLS
jgi:LuxR family quorum sensing-dependent transcriptional regulator